MQTLKQIKDDLLAYASSLDVSGVAVDRLCSLLAYSVYKNQVLQAQNILEANFSTSTRLNSRIHHAANLLYSVPRGRCPIVKVLNARSIEKKNVSYLDFVMLFNGYYFYYADDASYGIDSEGGENTISNLNLICSSKSLKTSTIDTSNSLYYADFISAENVSQDFRLYEDTNLVPFEDITNDASLFFYKDYRLDETGQKVFSYQYKYLAMTLPSYGLRIIRHSDTVSWDSSTLSIQYLPYSETVPGLVSLSSIPGFTFISDTTEGADLYTQIEVIPFEERLSDFDQIYANATASFLQQGTVATAVDLLIALKKKNSSGLYKVINDVHITKDIHGNYNVDPTPIWATVVYLNAEEDDLLTAIDVYKNSLSVTKNIAYVEASPRYINDNHYLYVVAKSQSKVLTNETLSIIATGYQELIGEELDHSKFEADIIRLGFDTVKVFTDESCTTETSFNIKCQPWEYPDLKARVVE